jgi:hypothetical protein
VISHLLLNILLHVAVEVIQQGLQSKQPFGSAKEKKNHGPSPRSSRKVLTYFVKVPKLGHQHRR